VTTLLYPFRAIGFNEGSALFFSVAELLLLLCSVYFEHNLLDPCALFRAPIGEDLVLCYPPPMPHRREFACIAPLDLCANLRGGIHSKSSGVNPSGSRCTPRGTKGLRVCCFGFMVDISPSGCPGFGRFGLWDVSLSHSSFGRKGLGFWACRCGLLLIPRD